jgi:hypothetical protein
VTWSIGPLAVHAGIEDVCERGVSVESEIENWNGRLVAPALVGARNEKIT